MDDLRKLRKLLAVARHAVVKAHAERNDEVGVVHRHGGSVVAVHALHTEETRVVGRNAGKAHQGATDRRVNLLGERQHFFLCFRRDETAAEVNERTLRGIDERRGFFDAHVLCRVAFFGLYGCLRLVVADRCLHVLRHIDEHRARSAGLRKRKRLADGVRQILHGADEVVVLRNGQRHARNVDLLEAVRADLCRRHVAANRDKRDGIEVRRRNAGHKVRCARAGGGHHHAHLAGCSRVAVRRVGSALLVRRQHVANFILIFIKTVINVQDLPARITENGVAALFN